MKPDKDRTMKENFQCISYMRISTRIQNKILASQIQKYILKCIMTKKALLKKKRGFNIRKIY
jgi:hypothetical protein